MPLGKFKNNGDYFEGDLEREDAPKMSVGLVYNFKKNTTSTGNQPGNSLVEPRDLTTYMADYILKYRGLSLSIEYLLRNADKSVLARNDEGDVRYLFVGSGENYQLGYIFKNDLGIAGRYSNILPAQDIRSEKRRIQEYVFGVSKYFKGHRLKAQTDIIRRIDDIGLVENNTPDRNWQIRLQIEMGI